LKENIELPINQTIGFVKDLMSDYLGIPKDIFQIYYKEEKKEDDVVLHTLDVAENDTFIIAFKEGEEICYKRSTSKDYTMSDQKHCIPFTVDKSIVITAVSFFRSYDNVLSMYDFFLYEVDGSGPKTLLTMLNAVKVMPSDCDAYNAKKVPIDPVELKPNVKYHAYVNYKIPDMRTYYSCNGTATQTISGVTFKLLDDSESGHRVSSTSGHLPYIFFKINNPYEE